MSRDKLSMDRVISAALEIAREDGFEALTMRRLAAELSVSQMAAYYYVKDKGELAALVADAALEAVYLPGPAAGTWEDRWLLQIQASFKAMALYPGLGQAMVSMRLTPRAVRLMHDIVEMLIDAGFSPEDARLAYALVHTYIFGRVMIKDRLRDRVARTEANHGRDVYFPKSERLSSSEFETYGLTAILTGIRVTQEGVSGGRARRSKRARVADAPTAKTANRASVARAAKKSSRAAKAPARAVADEARRRTG